MLYTRKRYQTTLLLIHGTDDEAAYASGSGEFAKLAIETNKDVTVKLWDGLHHEIQNEPRTGIRIQIHDRMAR